MGCKYRKLMRNMKKVIVKDMKMILVAGCWMPAPQSEIVNSLIMVGNRTDKAMPCLYNIFPFTDY
jgi:hypothetical protein